MFLLSIQDIILHSIILLFTSCYIAILYWKCTPICVGLSRKTPVLRVVDVDTIYCMELMLELLRQDMVRFLPTYSFAGHAG